jgi:CNT family concentrative nucleoside transporter
MLHLMSFFGLFAMVGLAWLMSSHKRLFPWRLVIYGILLQFAFAAMIFYIPETRITPSGEQLFDRINAMFVALVDCTDEGSKFLFGPKVVEDGSLLNNFAFRALPTIIFFASLMSILYYFGVMQWMVRIIAVVMQKTLRTSGAETLSAAANIFVGQTEAPLVVRPYLAAMTQSELMAVMVGGFANVAGSVMGIYVKLFGVDGGHLLTASVISAPASLLIAKVMQPEIEEPKTLGTVKLEAPSEATNVLHAAAIGCADGAQLAINVGAMLIAFLALIALVNLLLGFVGFHVSGWAQWLFGWNISPNWSLQAILAYVFAPLALLIGVEWGDCLNVGELMGIKMVANEFVAYDRLHKMMEEISPDGAVNVLGRGFGDPPLLSARSNMLATYALCGFANFSSIGIQIGGLGPLAPSRRADLAKLGFRAMLGGTLTSCMTACIAGVLL